MKNTTKIFALVLFVLLSISLHAQEEQTVSQHQLTKYTENTHFKVRITSKLDPIAINTMHAWIIHIEDKNGQDILDAAINVDGGMPEHNHGLPTRPLVTKYLGDGCYLLEGMKFHMGGWWTITFSITDGSIRDSVTFDLNL